LPNCFTLAKNQDMKRLFPAFFCACICFTFFVSGCSKSSSGTAPVSDVTLAVTLTPSINSNLAPAPIASTGQAVQVNITSTMPPSGVRIDIIAKVDGSTSTFYSNTITSTKSALSTFNVTGTPTGGAACVCTVTVTSLTSATNIWTGSFRYASK